MNRGEGGDAAQADDGQPEDQGPEDNDKSQIITVEPIWNVNDSAESDDGNDGDQNYAVLVQIWLLE